MLKIGLYNFNHEIQTPCEIKIDDFKIIISEEDIKNLENLTKNAKYSITNNFDGTKEVTNTPREIGEILQTATLNINKYDIESSIIDDFGDKDSVDDLVLFLSFLTGRKVFLKKDITQYSIDYYTYPVLNNVSKFFELASSRGSLANYNLKEKLTKIRELKLNNVFYHLIQSKNTYDLIAIGLYANVIIDAISNRWCKENEHTTYSEPTLEENELTNYIKNQVNDYLCNKEKNKVEIDDILVRININQNPSAIYKITRFLEGLSIITNEPTIDEENKIKTLNKCRNKLIHTGELYKITERTDLNISIVCAVVFILLDIADYYFATQFFDIDTDVTHIHTDLKGFFRTGIYKEVDVLKQTFDEYLDSLN